MVSTFRPDFTYFQDSACPLLPGLPRGDSGMAKVELYERRLLIGKFLVGLMRFLLLYAVALPLESKAKEEKNRRGSRRQKDLRLGLLVPHQHRG